MSFVLYLSKVSQMCLDQLATVKVGTIMTIRDSVQIPAPLDLSFPEYELVLRSSFSVALGVDLIDNFCDYFVHEAALSLTC